MGTYLAENALEALHEGVVGITDGRVVALNVAAAALLHVDAERALGASAMSVLRDHRMERALLDGRPLELVTRGRTVRVVPFPGGLVLRDVSEERRARDDARELLAVLSHELRTPVTTIRSALEALRHELPEAQRELFLQRAEEESKRLVRLLGDLTVDVAPPDARSVPLRAFVERAAALLAPTLEEHGVRLAIEIPPCDVWCDPDKLLQVLLNLVENAAVHGPDRAEVRVVARPAEGRPRWSAVEVLDAGAPLEPAAFDGLFSPHARSGAPGRGTGLGLYVVRSIAERWGGRSWGRAWERGNAFGFTVPGDRAAAQR